MNIITKRDLQKKIGKISGAAFTVVNRGKPEIIIVPYFEGGLEAIEDYMEDYEIYKNRQKLKKEMSDSLKSGKSDLKI